MRKLPEPFPKMYKQFMRGNFVVKIKPGTVNGVAPDIELEETI